MHLKSTLFIYKTPQKCWVFYKAINTLDITFVQVISIFIYYILVFLLSSSCFTCAGTAAFGPNYLKQRPLQSMVQAALKLALVPILNLSLDALKETVKII